MAWPVIVTAGPVVAAGLVIGLVIGPVDMAVVVRIGAVGPVWPR